MELLKSNDLTEAGAPYRLFAAWMREAEAAEINDPNAMALATVDAEGLPDVRMVLLKGVDERGFVFYTNTRSAKGDELAGQRKAAIVFHWKSLQRQVRVRGPVAPVSPAEADAYFGSRHRDSRIGAWASQQSRPLTRRADLEEAVGRYTAEFEGRDVPRPDYWSGFRIEPVAIEFWQDQAYRLHDRVRCTRSVAGWDATPLYP